MWLAGIPVRDTAVVELIDRLRAEDFGTHADHLQRTLDRGARIVALDEADRHAILRVLADAPDELLELRARWYRRLRGGKPKGSSRALVRAAGSSRASVTSPCSRCSRDDPTRPFAASPERASITAAVSFGKATLAGGSDAEQVSPPLLPKVPAPVSWMTSACSSRVNSAARTGTPSVEVCLVWNVTPVPVGRTNASSSRHEVRAA